MRDTIGTICSTAGELLEHDTQIARWMRMIAWLMCVGSIGIAVLSAAHQQQPEQTNPLALYPRQQSTRRLGSGRP
jgi:hypothetical protein